MADDSSEYFRQRAEEEQAAADSATDPGVTHVHRELARRYRAANSEGASVTRRAALSATG